MEIRGKRALVLGGAGLVGQAICRKLVEKGIGEIVISPSLRRKLRFHREVERGVGRKCPKLYAEWGNVFVRHALKDFSRNELMNDAENRGHDDRRSTSAP